MSATPATDGPRHWWRVNQAFLRIGLLDAVSYPVAFLLARLNVLMPVVLFAIISDLLATGSRDASEYFSYVIVGLVASELLDAGARGLGDRLSQEINTGRLETYLIGPVPLVFLPFGLVQFDLLARVVTAGVVFAISLPLGAQFQIGWSTFGAVGVVLLGLGATMSIAIAGSAVKILAKRSDPVLTIYALGARFFSGVFFPVEQLPGPLQAVSWLFPHTFVNAVARQLLLPPSSFDTTVSPRTAVIALVAMIVVILPLGMRFFLRAIDYGKRRGLLTGY